MRELLTKARERFGPDASRYKTRQELLEALDLAPSAVVAPVANATEPSPQPLVVKDFFLPPTKR